MESEIFRQPKVDFDSDFYETRQEWFTSKDGTKIAVGDPGQSVTNVIETTTSYGAGSTKKNQGGIVSSTNEFTSNFHLIAAS